MVLAQLSDEKSDRGKIKESLTYSKLMVLFPFSSFIPIMAKKNLKAMMDVNQYLQ